MSDSPVHLAVDGPLARVTFADAASGNALNGDTLRGLHSAVATAAGNAECRVIVIEGSAGVFCRGLDLTRVAQGGAGAERTGEAPTPPGTSPAVMYGQLLEAIRVAPQPMVALVDGQVTGGGNGLVAACDIVLATPAARFTLTEVIFGLVPWNVLPYLMARVSPAKARYLTMSAVELDDASAHAVGLVDERVEDAIKGLNALLKRLLRASPAALANAKRFTDAIARMPLREAISNAQGELSAWLGEPSNIDVIKRYLEGESLPWFAKHRVKPAE